MEAPVSASLGAMGSLPGKLDELATERLALQEVVKGQIEQLRTDLVTTQTHLLELSNAQRPPQTARYWMKAVRELSYDMDDWLDKPIQANMEDWIDKISGFKTRVEEANERYARYELDRDLSSTNTAIDHWLPTADGKPIVDPVGMDGHMEELGQWLNSEEQQLKVASIVGFGGVGKSTLVQKLWREFGGQFDCRAIVQTAKKPDMRRILRSILSQVRPRQLPDACQVHNLIHDLREHLQKNRYLIIVDDLWATSVWDVVSRAFPEGDHRSRIIITTTIEDVTLACCGYHSKHIFKMEPLSNDLSKKLFITRVFGSEKGCPQQFKDALDEITRKCGRLPLAIMNIAGLVASQPERLEHWENVQNCLHSNLRTNPTSDDEILKQVLNLCCNSLPHCLKTCLLYLSVYPENYTILREDLVKQWLAEGFICTEGEDIEEVARNYFDELVNLGLIQRMGINHNDEVLNYAVHPTVLDLITYKSIEDNFVTVIDYSQTKIGLSDKVRRLSLHFGSATYATTPASIRLSQVRSLTYMGLLNCMPSIVEFKLLRVAILHVWGDDANRSFDLTGICGLFRLVYLQIRCNVTVKLPDEMRCLKHLETLEINARVAPVPSDILLLSGLLHLRLGGETNLPTVNGNLKHPTLHPIASDMASVSSPPVSLQSFELPICIFSRLPEWIGQLRKLCILKIVVRELRGNDIDVLTGLPKLTVLSLYVRLPTAENIFNRGAFPVLRYFKYMCGVLNLAFQEEAMPNLRKLKLVFNAHRGDKYGHMLTGIEHLLKLQEIAGRIGAATGDEESDKTGAESVLKDAISKHPCCPSFNVKWVNRVDEDTKKRADSGIPQSSALPEIQLSPRPEPEWLGKATCNSMDNKSQHTSVTPKDLTFQLLEDITNRFSDDHKVGSGGYGDVYKGVLHTGEEIAVKKLHHITGLDDEQFKKEFNKLMRVKHQNIVRLVGYCYEIRHRHFEHNGEFIFARVEERALCFEYLQGGSLEKHLDDESCGLDWHMRYKIIKGICEGLNYLHNGFEEPICHMELKPANILLEKSMMPKIADFGLSRLFASTHTYTTKKIIGTPGYMPPEYIDKRQISLKFDIFSLGVIIIQIMAGRMGHSKSTEMSSQQFIELVHENWKNRLQATMSRHTSLEVKTCIEIALRCVAAERAKRPTITEIVDELNNIDTAKTSLIGQDCLAPRMAEAPPCSPPSWSKIPPEFAYQVLCLLPQVDRVRFAAVCPQWRAAARQGPPPLPVLALDGGTLYSLPRGESFLFPGWGGRYHSTCDNYLVFSRDEGFFLVDPFSRATMTLPGLSQVQPRFEADDEPMVDDKTFTWMDIKDPKELAMHKLIVCSPHLVAALVGFPDFGENQIVVCQPGASSWSVRAHNPFMRLCGMAFHQGELYALDCDMGLHAVDISVDHSTGDPWVSRIRLVIEAEDAMFMEDERFEGGEMILTMLYLVESHGALLMARRSFWCGRTSMYTRAFVVPRNSEFEVFEADFRRSRWKVTTVGDYQVLFLARWSSRAVSVSMYGMPGNRIFFWDDDLYHDAWLIHHDRESFSCSAYDMGDGTVSSPLPMISWKHGMVPATWEEFVSWKRGMVPATWLFPRD